MFLELLLLQRHADSESYYREAAQQRFFGRRPRPGLKSPPYLTAEPVISTTKISPEKGDFLIMATDGLWDRLTNEQAVRLVGKWLQKHDPSTEAPVDPSPLPVARDYDQEREDVKREARTRGHPEPQKAYTTVTGADPRHFVVKDSNAATHLVRNALGGGDEDLLRGLLTVPARTYFRSSTCPFLTVLRVTRHVSGALYS